MSDKRRVRGSLLCLVVLSLLALTTTACWGYGYCRRTQVWGWRHWCDTWGCHVERRKVTTWVCSGGGGRSQAEAQVRAIDAQPQPVIAMQVPEEYLGVPYPWQVVITPEGGTGQTFVISPIPIYDPSIINELEAQWPCPPGSWWRVFGVDPDDLARIRAALPPSGPFEVRAEGVFSFHAEEIQPTMVVAEFDPVTQEWIQPYAHAPEVPLVLEPHADQEVRPNTMLTFTHTLTNTGTTVRTFDLTYASELNWPYVISLAQAPQVPVTNTGPIAPGDAVDILVSTWVPPEQAGAVETVVVTATAQDDPQVTASVVDRVYVWHICYLPIVRRGTG